MFLSNELYLTVGIDGPPKSKLGSIDFSAKVVTPDIVQNAQNMVDEYWQVISSDKTHLLRLWESLPSITDYPELFA